LYALEWIGKSGGGIDFLKLKSHCQRVCRGKVIFLAPARGRVMIPVHICFKVLTIQEPRMNQPTHPHQPQGLRPPVPARPIAAPHSGMPPKIAAMPMTGHKATDEELAPLELIEDDTPAGVVEEQHASKIKAIGVRAAVAKQEHFARKPNATGQGACRVRSFHSRLSDEGVAYMDEKINDWLDRHPEIEVKFVTSTVGTFEGKIREPALVLNVWY